MPDHACKLVAGLLIQFDNAAFNLHIYEQGDLNFGQADGIKHQLQVIPGNPRILKVCYIGHHPSIPLSTELPADALCCCPSLAVGGDSGL